MKTTETCPGVEYYDGVRREIPGVSLVDVEVERFDDAPVRVLHCRFLTTGNFCNRPLADLTVRSDLRRSPLREICRYYFETEVVDDSVAAEPSFAHIEEETLSEVQQVDPGSSAPVMDPVGQELETDMVEKSIPIRGLSNLL